MKTRTWILLLGAVALALLVLTLVLLPGGGATWAEVWSDGTLVCRVDLSIPQSFRVQSPYGYNVVTVRDGGICVSEADCSGNDCVHTGLRSGGAPIICLPHRLVIRFSAQSGPDAVTR